jgi:hypothetical protein
MNSGEGFDVRDAIRAAGPDRSEGEVRVTSAPGNDVLIPVTRADRRCRRSCGVIRPPARQVTILVALSC